MSRFSHFSFRRFLAVAGAFCGGCLSCHLLRVKAGFGAVEASALTGLAGTFVIVPASVDKTAFQAAVYSGSFAGMCSAQVIDRPEQILLISLLGGVVWLVMAPVFPGVGGKLGAIAFATTSLVFLAKTLSW